MIDAYSCTCRISEGWGAKFPNRAKPILLNPHPPQLVIKRVPEYFIIRQSDSKHRPCYELRVTWKRQVFPPSCSFQVSCLRGNQVQLGAGPPSRTGRFWQSQQMTPWHPSCALAQTLVVKPPTSLVPTRNC